MIKITVITRQSTFRSRAEMAKVEEEYTVALEPDISLNGMANPELTQVRQWVMATFDATMPSSEEPSYWSKL